MPAQNKGAALPSGQSRLTYDCPSERNSRTVSFEELAYRWAIFKQISTHPRNRLAELLPDQWRAARRVAAIPVASCGRRPKAFRTGLLRGCLPGPWASIRDAEVLHWCRLVFL